MAERYTLRGHGHMIADAVRMDAYQAALERAVRPGSVVLDIGTGTGMMAMLACRLGARRVYAVEPGASIHVARAAARASGLADRIEFIQDVSTRVELPERADVVVSDLRGVLPPFEQHVASIADARERLLAPGGVLIPRADTLWAAPVRGAEQHRVLTGPWEAHNRGFDLSAARHAVVNTFYRARFAPDDLVAQPQTWVVLDYRTRVDPNVAGTLRWTAERDVTAHGMAVWFHAELAEGIGFATGPWTPETIYGSAFFPWLRPVELRAGDGIEVELQARLTGHDYVWSWTTRVEGPDGVKADFRQSTFLAQPELTADLRKRAHDFVPELGEDGRVDRAILEMMDGAAPLEHIAREIQRRFPQRFATWEDALSRVGGLSQAYAR